MSRTFLTTHLKSSEHAPLANGDNSPVGLTGTERGVDWTNSRAGCGGGVNLGSLRFVPPVAEIAVADEYDVRLVKRSMPTSAVIVSKRWEDRKATSLLTRNAG